MTRDEILTSLRERILAFATSRVSKDLAEDLTQEVLVLLHEKYARVTELTARPTAKVTVAPTKTFQVQAMPGVPKIRGENKPKDKLTMRPESMPIIVPVVLAFVVKSPRAKAPTVGPEA